MDDGVAAVAAPVRLQPGWREVLDAIPGLAFVADADGANLHTNEYFQTFTGRLGATLLGQGWITSLHPDDQARAADAWREAVVEASAYDQEYRFRAGGGEFRWFRCRASPTKDADGSVVRWVGVGFDVHTRRRAEESRDLVIAELSHRTKNLLTVVQAVAQLTARRSTDAEAFRREFSGRLAALARVNDLLAGSNWTALEFGRIVEAEIAPFGEEVAARVTRRGPEIHLRPSDGSTISLVLHELMTNAVKYGALRSADGEVEISWAHEGPRTRVNWRERGGPPIQARPTRRGFGTQLIHTVTARELGAAADYTFDPDGVRCSFTFETGAAGG